MSRKKSYNKQVKKVKHSLSSFSHDEKKIQKVTLIIASFAFLFIVSQVATNVTDNRPKRIDTYFSKHNLPLAGYGHVFVRTADKCDMDWRLLPAIAMQESTGGKFVQYNNPFGWGSAEIPFDSFDEAIVHVGKHLCGNVSTTERWYNTTSTYEKLWWYNGTVAPSYPDEVMWIMDQI